MAADIVPVGGSYLLTLNGLTNAADGSPLNSATVTYQLYKTSDNSVIAGGSGSMTYVAASAGDYQATLSAALTGTLVAGTNYYALMTAAQSGLTDPFRVDLTAQNPGLTILDALGWQEISGRTLSAVDLVSCQAWCESICDALESMCYPILLTPRTLTLYPVDAPALTRELLLPRPIRSISALYYHCNANGDSSQVDLTADLLVAGTDYMSRPDDARTNCNRSGIVLRLNRSSWGYLAVRPPTKLGYDVVDEPGSIFVSGSFGPDRISPAVRAAACSATTLMMGRRKTGVPLTNESWAGYSVGYASTYTAESAVRSPDVLELLRSVGCLPIHVG